VEAKFRRLAEPHADADLQDRTIDLCRELEAAEAADLAELLARVETPTS
jgi:hypothetical protein